MERLGFDDKTKPLNCSGESADHNDQEEQTVHPQKHEATEFRGAVARLNFLSQDSPGLMYLAKEISQEMASPIRGGWKSLKNTSRFRQGREIVVWE